MQAVLPNAKPAATAAVMKFLRQGLSCLGLSTDFEPCASFEQGGQYRYKLHVLLVSRGQASKQDEATARASPIQLKSPPCTH